MILLIKFAYRNLIRHSKRNRFAVLSIASGLAFLFWIQCILTGHNANMTRTVTKMFTGQVQIHHEDYLTDRLVQLHFNPDSNLIDQLNQSGLFWTTRVYFPAIISSATASSPVISIGLDANREPFLTKIKTQVTQGEFLIPNETCEEKQILISERLAKKLGVDLGEKLVIMGQAADGSLGNDLFRVQGFFQTSTPDFDKINVFAPTPCLQEVAAIGGVHEILISDKVELVDETPLMSRVQSWLQTPLKTSSWRDLAPGVANMIRYNHAMSSLITVILFSIVSLGVINAILMNIFERTREIGIQLAVGTTPNQVRAMILIESFFLAIVSGVVGTVLGFGVVLYHQKFGFDLTPFLGKGAVSATGYAFETHVYPDIQWGAYFKLFFTEVIFILLAGLYPAYKASKLKPIETIRG